MLVAVVVVVVVLNSSALDDHRLQASYADEVTVTTGPATLVVDVAWVVANTVVAAVWGAVTVAVEVEVTGTTAVVVVTDVAV